MSEHEEKQPLETPPAASTAPETSVSGELMLGAPDADFEPDLGEYEVEWVGEWEAPKPGRKNAYRKGVFVEDGFPVVVYENGSIRKDDGTGQWIRSGRRFRSEDGSASSAVEARYAKAREAATNGLAAAYESTGMSGVLNNMGNDIAYQAWAAVVQSRAEIAMDAGRGRDGTDAARFVGQATGMLTDGKHESENGGGVIRWELTGKVALEALRMLKESKGI